MTESSIITSGSMYVSGNRPSFVCIASSLDAPNPEKFNRLNFCHYRYSEKINRTPGILPAAPCNRAKSTLEYMCIALRIADQRLKPEVFSLSYFDTMS